MPHGETPRAQWRQYNGCRRHRAFPGLRAHRSEATHLSAWRRHFQSPELSEAERFRARPKQSAGQRGALVATASAPSRPAVPAAAGARWPTAHARTCLHMRASERIRATGPQWQLHALPAMRRVRYPAPNPGRNPISGRASPETYRAPACRDAVKHPAGKSPSRGHRDQAARHALGQRRIQDSRPNRHYGFRGFRRLLTGGRFRRFF